MQFLLLLGLLGLQGLCQLGVTAAPTQWIDTTLDECHDEYSLAAAKAGNIFAASYELCELTANETKIDLTVNEALERSQIEEGHSKLCGNLDMCDALDDDLEYFACIRDRVSIPRSSYSMGFILMGLNQCIQTQNKIRLV